MTSEMFTLFAFLDSRLQRQTVQRDQMFKSPKVVVNEQSGITLVEMLVVIVIIAIVAAIALMQSGSANIQFQRQNAATQLKNAFERARFDSVKRRVNPGEEATVTLSPYQYTLRTYSIDASGVAAANDQTTALPNNIVMGMYGGGPLTTQIVKFNMRGEAVTSPAPQFLVCNYSCNGPSNATANIVLVTTTGTVNLLPGGSTIPTFGVPSVTNVPGSTGVNPDTVTP